MLSQKGQAFDVFKLLIAAVIAIAILSLLMPIIGTIMGIFKNDPTDKAKAMLTDLYTKPSTPKETVEVTFDTSTPVISTDAVTLNTSLSPDQVCFSYGDYADNPDEWDITSLKLRHEGSTARNVRLGVECSRGIDLLTSDIESDFDGAQLEDCECSSEDICCAIVLRRAGR